MKSNLIELIKENPDLPIFAWVDYEIVGGDCNRWLGKLGCAEIKEYANIEPYGYLGMTMVFKDDGEDYLMHLYENELPTYDEYKDLSGEEIEKVADSMIDKLEYKKAIFVNVDLPDNI